jgi:homoserine kinase type II
MLRVPARRTAPAWRWNAREEALTHMQITTAFPCEEALRILRHWGITVSAEAVAPGSGTANASAIVTLPGRRLMLRRRNPRYAHTDWVRFDHALLAHLAAEGLPVPHGVPGPAGDAWLEEGQQIYELFDFIEGDQHREGDPGELAAAGATLARLHTAAAQFRPPVEKPWPRFHDPKDLPGWIEPLIPQASGDQREVMQRALNTAHALVKWLPDDLYRALPQTVVQGDYHPANLKFRAGRVVGVFDWDWASRQPRMVDVADGLLFFCGVRRAPLITGDIWSLTGAFTISEQRAQHFLGGYRSASDLSADELQALPNLMRARWLYCRVDAARRKVEPDRAVEFITRDLLLPLDGMDLIEAKLGGASGLKSCGRRE